MDVRTASNRSSPGLPAFLPLISWPLCAWWCFWGFMARNSCAAVRARPDKALQKPAAPHPEPLNVCGRAPPCSRAAARTRPEAKASGPPAFYFNKLKKRVGSGGFRLSIGESGVPPPKNACFSNFSESLLKGRTDRAGCTWSPRR